MLTWDDVHSAVKPLRFIFWGAILWVFDVTFSSTTNGSGFRCDILDDTVGTLLIAVGVFRLARVPVGGRYPQAMAFLKGVAVASIGSTALRHFIFEVPPFLTFLLTLLGLCQLVGTVLFCLAMRWFSEAAGLPTVARSWRVTFILFCVIYLLPLGALDLASLLATVGGTLFHFNLGPAVLLLLPVFAVPLVHLFVSTSRMRRAAEHGVGPGGLAGHGFPVITRGDEP